MISIHMVDDRVVFYTYKVECQPPSPPENVLESAEDTGWEEFQKRFSRYRIESDGLYADNASELAAIESGLRKLAYEYEVLDISPTSEQIARAEEIAGYSGSPQEVMEYLLSDIVPEQLAYKNEINALRDRIESLEKEYGK